MRIYWKKRQSFSTAGAARECNGGCLCPGRSPCLSNLPRATACFELSLGVGGKLGVCAPVGARVGMPPQMPSWWRRSAHRSLMPVPRWLLGLLCIAATLPSAVTFLCRPAVIGSDAGRSSGRTQLAATAAPIARRKKGSALVKRIPPPSVKVTKLAKGERYRGYINPKLKALVAAPEYRKVVDLLFKLENEKKLDMLLANAQDYWLGLNIYEASRL
ncbi:unnamed protein product, partial [Symbiodinium necroappetens]